jgi:hypothetical protein
MHNPSTFRTITLFAAGLSMELAVLSNGQEAKSIRSNKTVTGSQIIITNSGLLPNARPLSSSGYALL